MQNISVEGSIRRKETKIIGIYSAIVLMEENSFKGSTSEWLCNLNFTDSTGNIFSQNALYLHHHISLVCCSRLPLQEFSLSVAPLWADSDPEYTRHSRIWMEITTKEHVSHTPLTNPALGRKDGEHPKSTCRNNFSFPLQTRTLWKMRALAFFQKLCS